jgi:hypothetical protein
MLMLILSLVPERLDGFGAINDFRCIDGLFVMVVMVGWLRERRVVVELLRVNDIKVKGSAYRQVVIYDRNSMFKTPTLLAPPLGRLQLNLCCDSNEKPGIWD